MMKARKMAFRSDAKTNECSTPRECNAMEGTSRALISARLHHFRHCDAESMQCHVRYLEPIFSYALHDCDCDSRHCEANP